jgi:hypothetical protein
MASQFKPNVIGQAQLIAKAAGNSIAKSSIHAAFVNYSEVAKEQFTEDLTVSSKFGIPTFDTFSFNASVGAKLSYTASKDFGGGTVNIVAPFTFDTALIEINQTKNIVKTAIAGTNGTVKEYMSEGDFIINLKGVIVGDVANQRPDVIRLNSLVAYLKAPLAIPISCHFLEELLISSVVIDSYKLGQREGARNIIDVDISMLSDSPIELSTSQNTTTDRFTTNRAFF